ncbi:MAG: peptidoglycan-associated lipoprotein [Dasania sp.]|jgi:peptidoglycan-associated lipoprotein
MSNKFCKIALVAIAASLLAACGSKNNPLATTNNAHNNAVDNSGQHTQNNHQGGMHQITPGSLEEYRKNIGDRVLFGTAEYVLSSDAKNTLRQQAAWLKQYAAGRSVMIEGHADERGTREYNIALGARRANSVRNYLVSQGIPMSAFNAVSYGKERPAVEGSDSYAWAKNRRAVVTPQ